MKLPNKAHTSRPWRIHEITPDFRLYDVWALPTPGGPDDLPRLVQQFAVGDTADNPSWFARTLFAIRSKLGALLGWDDPDSGVGSRVQTLRDRLPVDLRAGPSGPEFDTLPFTSVYLTDNEWAAEMANRTVHAVMHIGWVPDDAGGYRGQMAVSGEAERSVREGIHGRNRTVSAPDRLPAADARHRTVLAGWRRASPINSEAIFAATGDCFSARGRI
jgi:Protein of unknown function (DUF2867)